MGTILHRRFPQRREKHMKKNPSKMMDFDEKPEIHEVRPERPRSRKEKLLIETLKYWGFYNAASNIDVQRDRIDIDAAIESWKNYPACMEEYPKVVTKKIKIDMKDF